MAEYLIIKDFDLRDPDDRMSWQDYNRLCALGEKYHKRSAAAKKGWKTRKKKKNK